MERTHVHCYEVDEEGEVRGTLVALAAAAVMNPP
jgi:hypothetical protein